MRFFVAIEQLVFPSFRPQEFPSHLRRYIHSLFFPLRRGHQSRLDLDCAKHSGSRWRSVAADFASHSSGEFSPRKARLGDGRVCLGVVVAPVLGPTLCGWLTDQYSWRWAFYIDVPVGIVAVLMISRFIGDPPDIRSAKPGRMDAIGLGCLPFGWARCKSKNLVPSA
jgi:hypothetical protein